MAELRFQRAYLEITNVCNLRCPFCPPGRRAPGFMSREQLLRALEQLRPYTRYLYFHVKGEPLLHPLLPEFLDLAGERGFLVNLTTNGLLVPELAGTLARAPALRQVNLSLHSYRPQSHGDAAAWISALAAYARQSAGAGKHTVFRIWTLDRDRAASGSCRALLALLSRDFPEAGDLAACRGQRSVTLREHIFLSFEEEFAWPSLSAPEIPGPGTCYGTRRMIGVLLDGTVVPCCLDGEGECPLGNLFRQELADILAGPVFTGMARGFRERRVVHPLCQRCGYRLRFNPSPSPPPDAQPGL